MSASWSERAKQRHQRGATPFNLKYGPGSGWRIGFGVSSFLVAEGSGFSRKFAPKIIAALDAEYRRLTPKKRKRRPS